MRLFADIDVHPVVSPDNWHIYATLCDYIALIKEDAAAVLSIINGNWISVEDKMPEAYERVLIANRSGVNVAWYNGRYWERGASTRHRALTTVTHWMPLPAPPEI